MNRPIQMLFAICVMIAVPTLARATITITQGMTAPTYTTTLNFDEPGGPTGINVPNNSWAGAPYNITTFQSGTGTNDVGPHPLETGQSTNSYFGPFGVFIEFGNNLTEMSFDAWDSSGPPSPFGGGMGVFVFDNGVEIGSGIFTPAFGGVGDAAYDITTSGGMVFDEVRILGFGFPADTYVDNLSWNVVPEPTGMLLTVLAGLGGLALRRRS